MTLLSDGRLVIGGEITQAGGQNVKDLAIWDGVSWSTLPGGPFGGVNALAQLANGDLVAAGSFFLTSDPQVSGVARWDGAKWSKLGAVPNDEVTAMSVRGDRVVIAGDFTSVGGLPARGIARWDGVAWESLGGGVPPLTPFVVLQASDDRVLLGGDFRQVDSVIAAGLAVYAPTVVATIATSPTDTIVRSGGKVVLRASPGAGYRGVSVQWHRNGAPISNGPGGASAGGGVVSQASAVLESPTTDAFATLTITNAQASDAGVFVATFSNACGAASSQPATLVFSGCVADLQGDGVVDDADFQIFVVAYDILDCADPSMPGGCPADLNADGFVDDLDFQIFAVAYDQLLCP
jgi:hypothetical protein